jgi:hypothetical protein
MRITNAVGCLFIAVSLLLSIPANAAIVAPIGLVGSQYQLIFVTADGDHPDGLNTPAKLLESYYNNFVTTEASLSAGLPSATWNVVGSADVAANVNAPAPLPVYNTAGQLVAAAGTLYSGSLTNSVGYDQYGNVGPQIVWTGTDSSGNTTANPLGGTAFLTLVSFGLSTSTTGTWLEVPGGGDPSGAQSFSYYALSSAITVPEPSTLALLTLGTIAFLVSRSRSR